MFGSTQNMIQVYKENFSSIGINYFKTMMSIVEVGTIYIQNHEYQTFLESESEFSS